MQSATGDRVAVISDTDAEPDVRSPEHHAALRTSDLYWTGGITDAGLKEMAALEHLTTLDLSFTQVTAAGLKELAGLKNLRSLNISGTHVTNKGLKELSRLKNLQA